LIAGVGDCLRSLQWEEIENGGSFIHGKQLQTIANYRKQLQTFYQC
jgi:hypothetical protein